MVNPRVRELAPKLISFISKEYPEENQLVLAELFTTYGGFLASKAVAATPKSERDAILHQYSEIVASTLSAFSRYVAITEMAQP